MPQSEVPTGPLRLRLSAGAHYLRRVLPAVEESAGPYTLMPHESLLVLDTPAGPRNFYRRDGLLQGSERLERFWLWPSGVVSPGAMRQYGHHATAFIGQRHFDDPFLLEEWFGKP